MTVIRRPGHSSTDTLFVDLATGIGFVGDHLLADISSNTEVNPERPLSRAQYLDGLRATAALPLSRLYAGHGELLIEDHPALIRRRLTEHADRCATVTEILSDGHASAFKIGQSLWSSDIVGTQALLVIWEVLGHLEILRNGGIVREQVDDHGRTLFELRA